MLLVDHPDGKVAVAQPSHAWISGQLARAWGGDMQPREEVCLAAEQHDIAWLEWERDPQRLLQRLPERDPPVQGDHRDAYGNGDHDEAEPDAEGQKPEVLALQDEPRVEEVERDEERRERLERMEHPLGGHRRHPLA